MSSHELRWLALIAFRWFMSRIEMRWRRQTVCLIRRGHACVITNASAYVDACTRAGPREKADARWSQRCRRARINSSKSSSTLSLSRARGCAFLSSASNTRFMRNPPPCAGRLNAFRLRISDNSRCCLPLVHWVSLEEPRLLDSRSLLQRSMWSDLNHGATYDTFFVPRKTRAIGGMLICQTSVATLLAGVFPYRTRIAFVSLWWNYNDGVLLVPRARAYKVGCAGPSFVSTKHTRQVRQASRFKVGRHESC